MLNRLKTALARTIPFCRKPKPVIKEFSSLNIVDRLHDVICQLAVIDMAIFGGAERGFEMNRDDVTGLLSLLQKQTDELRTLRDAIYRSKRKTR